MPRETPAIPQTAFISDPFSAAHKRLRPQRPKVKNSANATVKDIRLISHDPRQNLTSANIRLCHPLETQPPSAGIKRIRNEKCLSEASCFRFPFYRGWWWEKELALASASRFAGGQHAVRIPCSTPKGCVLRSPSLAYLSWRSKKGKWPPGHTRPGSKTCSRITQSQAV